LIETEAEGFILPAWYQIKWFGLLVIILVLLVFWWTYTYRVRKLAVAMRLRFDERLAERTRLARDLHDSLLQTIQGSKMVADDALDESSDVTRLKPAMETLSRWLGQAILQGGAAFNSLHTSSTKTNDLADAFRRALEDCLLFSSINAEVHLHGAPRDMHPVVHDEIYLIGYEAIRNACLHSKGCHLEVTITCDKDLTLSVADDGKGIDPKIMMAGRRGHYGISGMRERAEHIGAIFDISTSSTRGTHISLVVPGRALFISQ
jgi:signal transduction histidine kinase